MKYMPERKKIFTIVILVFLLTCISLGYLSFSKSLSLETKKINCCQADNQCMLVDANGYCGGTTSINSNNITIWNLHLFFGRITHPMVMCKPNLPREWFQAQCINTRCQARNTRNGGTLIFDGLPLVGKPVPLRFTFTFNEEVSRATGNIELPNGIALVEGNLDWQGDLVAGQTQELKSVVEVQDPGYYIINAVAKPSQGNEVWKNLNASVRFEAAENDTYLESDVTNHWKMRYAFQMPENNQGITSELIVQPKPAINQEFVLIYRVRTPEGMLTPHQGSIVLLLPDKAFKVIDVQAPTDDKIIIGEHADVGIEIHWDGIITTNQEIEIVVTLRVLSTGWDKVSASLTIVPGDELKVRIIDTVLAEIFVGNFVGGFTIRKP